MGTLNKINLQKTIDKYTATNQVKVENGNLEVLEKDKKKADKIMWELAEHSPQIALQMFGGKQ
jgi:hypothetical protein